MMKKVTSSAPWYNVRDKEICGILLEGREAMLRCGGPYPDARAGLRFLGVNPQLRTTIL